MKTKPIGLRRLLAAALALSMAAAVLLPAADRFAPVAAAETKQEQLEREKKEAQQQLDAIKEQIAQRQENIENEENRRASMETQSKLITQQINILVEQIAETQKVIIEKEDAIASKQAEIDRRWEGFKARMAAMQEINDRGGIAILSQATNLYELLTFSQTLQDISEKDNQVLSELQAARQELEQQKQELELEKARLEEQEAQLDSKKGELAASIRQANENISAEEAALQADEEAAAAARKQLDAATAALESYLRSCNDAYANVKFDSSLGFRSPLDSFKYKSCEYGAGGHKGVDWAAAGGTPIHAAADGVVSISEYHYSYGNYVQIYHGTDDNGVTYASLYAHMNSTPAVSKGQTVHKGDIIGYVGTTGNSTGNHLHLELRVNGGRVSPESYIPQPAAKQ